MAIIRIKDLPGNLFLFGNSDYIAADENASGETKKVNKDSILAGLGLATARVTVVSITNPIPNYVGQPGIDSAGKTYVAIALSGTMWEETGVNNDSVTLSKLKKILLENQIELDTTKTTITHDISAYSFTAAPFVLLSIKSEWGVYIQSVSATAVVLGINSFGVGTIKYDLLLIYQ